MEQKKNSIEKTLIIILSFLGNNNPRGVRELSIQLGFSHSTVQRILKILESYGFVFQDHESRKYRLGNIYFDLVRTVQDNYSISSTAMPFMKRLYDHTSETVHINVIDKYERICILNMESHLDLKANMRIGDRCPLYVGATSKCLLAFSEKSFQDDFFQSVKLTPLTQKTTTHLEDLQKDLQIIRNNGYSTSLGEGDEGLGAISAPILGANSKLLCAISLAIPELRYTNQDLRNAYIEKTLAVAQEFSKHMGFRPHNAQPRGGFEANKTFDPLT